MIVTKKIAIQDNFYEDKEKNQTYNLRVVPQMTSTLRSDLIFGDNSKKEDRINILKTGYGLNPKPTNNEKRENLSRLTLPSIVNKYVNLRNNRLALIC